MIWLSDVNLNIWTRIWSTATGRFVASKLFRFPLSRHGHCLESWHSDHWPHCVQTPYAKHQTRVKLPLFVFGWHDPFLDIQNGHDFNFVLSLRILWTRQSINETVELKNLPWSLEEEPSPLASTTVTVRMPTLMSKRENLNKVHHI